MASLLPACLLAAQPLPSCSRLLCLLWPFQLWPNPLLSSLSLECVRHQQAHSHILFSPRPSLLLNRECCKKEDTHRQKWRPWKVSQVSYYTHPSGEHAVWCPNGSWSFWLAVVCAWSSNPSVYCILGLLLISVRVCRSPLTRDKLFPLQFPWNWVRTVGLERCGCCILNRGSHFPTEDEHRCYKSFSENVLIAQDTENTCWHEEFAILPFLPSADGNMHVSLKYDCLLLTAFSVQEL